jgi:hypothetical protein
MDVKYTICMTSKMIPGSRSDIGEIVIAVEGALVGGA